MSASNGQEALDYLRQSQPLPDLILLDLMMPIMNGWEFLQERKHQPLLASVPLIVISANDVLDNHLALFGVAACLQKPVTLKVLLEMVAQLGAQW